MTGKPKVEFDHWEQSFADDPFPTYDRLRGECPIAWSDANEGFWVVFDHALMTDITHRPDVFSSKYVAVPRDIGFGDAPLPPLNLDPPNHTRVRRLLAPAFSPGRVASLEPVTTRIVNDLIDQFIGTGRCDASADFAKSVPIAVLCRMFGLPAEDEDRFVGWVQRIIEHGGQNHDDAVAAAIEMFGYFTDMLQARRSQPHDDLVSLLAHAEIEGERLTDDEIVGCCSVLLLAGIDTTWSTLGSAIWHLAQHDGDRRRLAAEPALADSAVEEILRAYAPTSIARMVSQDHEVHGVEMHAGDMMLLPLVCANRDENQFPDAQQVILDRQPNRHMAFGVGIHRCLGAGLARMELRVALQQLLARIPDFHLESDASVVWSAGPIRGPRQLPITFPPAADGR